MIWRPSVHDPFVLERNVGTLTVRSSMEGDKLVLGSGNLGFVYLNLLKTSLPLIF